ncbi:MAG: saccharopine dehydrogenase NADP-binding domain-containing protein [Deltaproteobacteria bacterium]|nr:saccharopine dehydrogenase NADP-binding domain-containing protein [Deltaproteobacteria bacterium]
MRLIVLGAGKMGRAIAADLVRAKGAGAVEVVDADPGRARALGESLGVRHAAIDLRDHEAVSRLLEGATAAVSAADYSLNEALTRIAIETRTHLCDLGGNIHVVGRQLAMSPRAEAAGVTVVPDCGLAPGLACLLAWRGVELVEDARRVRIRVGGLPAHPKPPLDYSLVFSVRGLTNEYLEPSEVLRDGEVLRLESLTEVERLSFPAPYGELEAFLTSGGASTLVRTLAGRVRDLDYKTIRYPGHAHIVKAMIDLGFLSEAPVEVGGRPIVPRQVTEALFERALDHGDDDVVLVRVTVEGASSRVAYQIIDRKDPATGHSAMMRTTGYPASIIALFLADGRITRRGVVTGELSVPVDAMIEELGKRGVRIEMTREPI